MIPPNRRSSVASASGWGFVLAALVCLIVPCTTRAADTPDAPSTTPTSGPTSAPAAKLPLPSAAKQAEVEQLIKSVHKGDYADRSVRGRTLLAHRLMEDADTSSKDPAARYVLLREARDRAAEAGEVDLALEAAGAIADGFDVDDLAVRVEAVVRSGAGADNPKQYEAVAHAALDLIDEADDADRYETAQRLGAVAMQAANNSKSKALDTEVTAKVREVRTLSLEYNRAKPAAEKLKTDPTDAAANGVMGRFLCLIKDDWEGGLPLLAKGDDPAIADLAQRDLAKPTASMAFSVAGDWWTLGEQQADAARLKMRSRACFWYGACHEQLKGLEKALAEKRLFEAGEPVAAAEPGGKPAGKIAIGGAILLPGLFTELYNDKKLSDLAKSRVDPQIDFTWGKKGPDEGIHGGHFSIRWTGQLRVPPAGMTLIAANADDAARVVIDGEKLIDFGHPSKVSKEVKLTPGLHSIVVEYHNNTGPGHMKLAWSLANGEPQPIPPEAFFHTPQPGE